MTTGVNRLGRCSVISDKYDTKPGRVKTSQPRNTTHDIWRRWDADINAQLSFSAGHHPEVIYRIQHHISISSRSRRTRTLGCNLTMCELVREEILEVRSGVFLIWDNPIQSSPMLNQSADCPTGPTSHLFTLACLVPVCLPGRVDEVCRTVNSKCCCIFYILQ